MYEIKQQIILSEGIPVTLNNPDSSVVETTALLGRAVKQFNSMISLEAHRRALCLPDTNFQNGTVIVNGVTNETFLTVATFNEVINNTIACIVGYLLTCNSNIDVYGVNRVANEFGDIVNEKSLKISDLHIFTQTMTSNLKQQDSGIFLDTEFLIYAPYFELETLDRVVLKKENRNVDLKVIHVDSISYDGVIVIQACTDTRK